MQNAKANNKEPAVKAISIISNPMANHPEDKSSNHSQPEQLREKLLTQALKTAPHPPKTGVAKEKYETKAAPKRAKKG